MSKYNLTYHLAAGVSVTVDAVSGGDVATLAAALENGDSVIKVGNKKNERIQLIPVRNILVVDATPVGAKDGE